MPDVLTTADLVKNIRDQADEQNSAAKSDPAILAILNRGQRVASAKLAQNYPDPLFYEWVPTLVSGTADYALPDDAFENRIEHVEFVVGGQTIEVPGRRRADISELRSGYSVPIPAVWTVVG